MVKHVGHLWKVNQDLLCSLFLLQSIENLTNSKGQIAQKDFARHHMTEH